MVSNDGIVSKWNSLLLLCKKQCLFGGLGWTLICIHFQNKVKIHILLDIFNLLFSPNKSQKGDHETWPLPSLLWVILVLIWISFYYSLRQLDDSDMVFLTFCSVVYTVLIHAKELTTCSVLNIFKILTSHKIKTLWSLGNTFPLFLVHLFRNDFNIGSVYYFYLWENHLILFPCVNFMVNCLQVN